MKTQKRNCEMVINYEYHGEPRYGPCRIAGSVQIGERFFCRIHANDERADVAVEALMGIVGLATKMTASERGGVPGAAVRFAINALHELHEDWVEVVVSSVSNASKE